MHAKGMAETAKQMAGHAHALQQQHSHSVAQESNFHYGKNSTMYIIAEWSFDDRNVEFSTYKQHYVD